MSTANIWRKEIIQGVDKGWEAGGLPSKSACHGTGVTYQAGVASASWVCRIPMVNLNASPLMCRLESKSIQVTFFSPSSKVDHSCSGPDLQDHTLSSCFGNRHIFCPIWALVKVVSATALLSRVETKMLQLVQVPDMQMLKASDHLKSPPKPLYCTKYMFTV